MSSSDARQARAAALAQAFEALTAAAATDPTVTGATVMLPSGEMIFLDATTARIACRANPQSGAA